MYYIKYTTQIKRLTIDYTRASFNSSTLQNYNKFLLYGSLKTGSTF